MNAIITTPPKTRQIADIIKNEISSLRLAPGMRLMTARQLAEKFSVSKHIVQNAFKILEKEGIVETFVGCGTFVAKAQEKDSIAVIFDLIHLREGKPSFADQMLEKLNGCAIVNDMLPHFMTGNGQDAETFIKSLNLDSSVWKNIKGVVAMARKNGFKEALSKRGIPLVYISSTHPDPNTVIFDYESLGRQAAKLLSNDDNHEIYVIYNQENKDISFNNPAKAFVDEYTEIHGKKAAAAIKLIASPITQEDGFELGRKIGASAEKIFFSNEYIAAGFAKWMENSPDINLKRQIVTQISPGMGLKIPSSYTKLAFPFEEIAAETMKMLSKLRNAPLNDFGQIYVPPVKLSAAPE